MTISSDVGFVLKSLDQSQENHIQFDVEYRQNERLDGRNRLTKEETQFQPKVHIESVNDHTYRALVMRKKGFFLKNVLSFEIRL